MVLSNIIPLLFPNFDTTNHIKETKIIIKNKKGEDSLGKPKGTYITIEAKDLSTNDGSFHKEMSEALFLNLKEMLNKKKKILIAGLGNAGVTADSLGPKVVNNLYICLLYTSDAADD